jgi:uncharacterized protein Yka (UPF0111/DUF47 family)
MSDISKRLTTKVLGSCTHSVPVLVPCPDCVERHLVSWEQRIREEVRLELTDEMKRAKVEVTECRAKMENTIRHYDHLQDTISDLKAMNLKLVDRIRAAERENDDMEARLHADQAIKHFQPRAVRGA